MKSRNWCFTDWEKPREEAEGLSVVKYFIYQLEVTPSTNREHYQGYVEFKHAVTMARAKQALLSPRSHLEIRRGSQQQAVDYCRKKESRKEGTIPYEWGDLRNAQGHRSDLDAIHEAIVEGHTAREILLEFGGHAIRNINNIIRAQEVFYLKHPLDDHIRGLRALREALLKAHGSEVGGNTVPPTLDIV